MSCRKYTFNENFFNKIDNEEKAYFLGLLYADGCNNQDYNNVTLQLSDPDQELVDKFKTALLSNHRISKIELSKRNSKWKDAYKIALRSKIFCSDLTALGCTPRKSLTLKFPTQEQVPKHLQRHFIRGYFDGDGSLGFYRIQKGNTFRFSCHIVSTNDFCETLKGIVLNELGVNSCVRTATKSNNITKTITFSGDFQIIKFLEWLYKDSSIHMNRKYEKFKSITEERTKERKSKKHYYKAFGEEKTLIEWSKDARCVVPIERIYHRFLSLKWPLEKSMMEAISTDRAKNFKGMRWKNR